MTFRRTTSGLNNSYLFFGVDAVVYLEGGDSITKQDVENGIFSASTDDIRYWQILFGFYKPEKSYQFCSVGSKETVKSIADEIIQGRVQNVIVAMDRDFDNLNNRTLSHDNIIYTFGYSWENDAWTSEAVLEAYCVLSGSCKTGIHTEKEVIESFYEKISHDLHGAVYIDAVLSQNNSSLFCRNSYMRYVDIPRSGNPNVKVQEIKKSLTSARKRLGKPIFKKSNFHVMPLVDCFGHLLAEFSYRILQYLLDKVKNLPKIPKSYAISMVVEKFAQLLQDGDLPVLKNHYDVQFAGIMP